MTARHQLRIGNRRLGRDRSAIDSAPAPRIGETLQLARERKGVDLYRAERDTKIRLRYLSALEDGAYEDLPAPVYTKGFLRNYAIYLGLDPDEILERWRDEMESLRSVERVVVAPPPQPMAAPGRHLTLTPGMLVAGLVALVVVAFIGYLAVQLLRYVETTPVGLIYPPNRVSTIDADKIILEGTSGPGARITITGPGDTPYSTDANEEGEWSREVQLARGRNDFTITATDAVTQRESTPLALTINVPLPSQPPGASPGAPTAAPPATLVLTLFGPTEGQVSTDGNVLVRGTTSGSRVTINSTYLGTPLATPQPSPSAVPSPEASPSPTPRKTPKPTPTDVPPASPTPRPTSSLPPIGPATSDITVAESGAFSETLSFPIGRWELTITAHGTLVTPISETRIVTVSPPFASGLTLVISVEGSNSWVKLLADGTRVGGYGTLHVGDTRTATAVNEICLRTGNAGALKLNLNGLDIGLLGRAGQVGSWVIRPGQGPVPADAPC